MVLVLEKEKTCIELSIGGTIHKQKLKLKYIYTEKNIITKEKWHDYLNMYVLKKKATFKCKSE